MNELFAGMPVTFPTASMVTEEEATAKWCPFVKTDFAGYSGEDPIKLHFVANRDRVFYGPAGSAENNATLCIGSKCMGWRYVDDARRRFIVHDVYDAEAEPARPDGVPPDYLWCPRSQLDGQDPTGWLEPAASANLRRRGYCGLAGRP